MVYICTHGLYPRNLCKSCCLVIPFPSVCFVLPQQHTWNKVEFNLTKILQITGLKFIHNFLGFMVFFFFWKENRPWVISGRQVLYYLLHCCFPCCLESDQCDWRAVCAGNNKRCMNNLLNWYRVIKKLPKLFHISLLLEIH